MDLAVGGEEAAEGSNNPRNLEIYENIGTGFQMIYQEISTGINLGSCDWGDYDKDGDLDLLVTGSTFGNSTFRNTSIIDNTAGGFVKNTDIALIGVGSGSGEWGDYDNDGDLDILLNGNTFEGNVFDRITLIYENTNSGFNVVFESTFTGTEEGEATWGDYDDDGDLGVLVIGRNSDDFTDLTASIYENRGDDFIKFEDLASGVRIGSVSWGDYENDGDLDILLAGQDTESNTITRIYLNGNGTNTFSTNTPPTTPTNLAQEINDASIFFSWDPSSDNQTAQDGLNYNLHLRSDNDTLITSQSRLNGYRKLVAGGNAGSLKSIEFPLELDPGDYYWKVQAIDNSFAGSAFSNESTFHINFPPEIIGLVNPLTTPEETPLLIMLEDLVVSDPDNEFPSDFSLTVTVIEGENYIVENNEIIPDTDFNGMITIGLQVTDGADESEVLQISIEVTPVNDVPVILDTNVTFSTLESTPLLINVNDLVIQDPDNTFPDDFTLTVLDGENYSVNENQVIPDPDFSGTLSISIVVNDGTDDSAPFNTEVVVEEVVGLQNEFVLENFVVYPNPAEDYLHINATNLFENYHIKIYSLGGHLIYDTLVQNTEETHSVDLSSYNQGTYIIQFIGKGESGAMLFIKR